MDDLLKRAEAFRGYVTELTAWINETGKEFSCMRRLLQCATGINDALQTAKSFPNRLPESCAQAIQWADEFHGLMEQMVGLGVITEIQSRPLLTECMFIKEEAAKLMGSTHITASFCSKCGAAVMENARFCNTCGQPLKRPISSAQRVLPAQQQYVSLGQPPGQRQHTPAKVMNRKRKRPPVWGLAGGFAAVLCAAVILIINVVPAGQPAGGVTSDPTSVTGGERTIDLLLQTDPSESECLARVRRGNQWGFIDTAGREVVPPQYEDAGDFHEGLAAVQLNGQWGFIDTTGRTVVPFEYEDAGDFHAGLAAVCKDGQWGFIDTMGAEVVAPAYDEAFEFFDK